MTASLGRRIGSMVDQERLWIKVICGGADRESDEIDDWCAESSVGQSTNTTRSAVRRMLCGYRSQ
jgi:hypothetical protein